MMKKPKEVIEQPASDVVGKKSTGKEESYGYGQMKSKIP